jgi:predicted Zn-dependent protease with MMP-like domain
MFSVTQKQFEQLVQEAVDSLPKIHRDNIKNIAFFVRKKPSKKQSVRSNLKIGDTLFGLYEGVPLSQRNGVTMLMPDTITLFQEPIESRSRDLKELRIHIKHTIWHEVAHYFGLDHSQIHGIERTFRDNKSPSE